VCFLVPFRALCREFKNHPSSSSGSPCLVIWKRFFEHSTMLCNISCGETWACEETCLLNRARVQRKITVEPIAATGYSRFSYMGKINKTKSRSCKLALKFRGFHNFLMSSPNLKFKSNDSTARMHIHLCKRATYVDAEKALPNLWLCFSYLCESRTRISPGGLLIWE